jgi:hypothetical protein
MADHPAVVRLTEALARWEVSTDRWMRFGQDPRAYELDLFAVADAARTEVPALLASHAALTDRLARAEAALGLFVIYDSGVADVERNDVADMLAYGAAIDAARAYFAAPPQRPHVQRAATDRRCTVREPWGRRAEEGQYKSRKPTSADRFAARFDAELQRRGMFIPNVEDLDDLLERALPIVGDPFLDARASRARARVTEIFVALRAWAP